jgi:hypothetical protein
MLDIDGLEEIERQATIRVNERDHFGRKVNPLSVPLSMRGPPRPEPRQMPKPDAVPAPVDVEDLKTIAARARWSGIPLRSLPDVLAAMRARRDELGITFETLDAIAGWPCRYGSKLFSPEPVKNLGWQSLGLGLGALGTMLIMIEDEEQIRRVQDRWIRRERPQLQRSA